jgi:hypothetical protein
MVTNTARTVVSRKDDAVRGLWGRVGWGMQSGPPSARIEILARVFAFTPSLL